MDQSSALFIKLRQWKGNKSEAKAMRKRRMLAVAKGEAPVSSLSGDLTDRHARKVERRVLRGHHGGIQARRLEGDVYKADRLEYLSTDSLIWVVLCNIDDGKHLRHILVSLVLTSAWMP
jgi:hypothetical protein